VKEEEVKEDQLLVGLRELNTSMDNLLESLRRLKKSQKKTSQ